MAESTSFTETGIDEVQLLRQQFSSWRRRFVLWKTFHSVNSFLFVLLAAIAAVLVLDHYVALPWILRLCLLIVLGLFVGGFAARSIRYLRNPPQFAMLARSVGTNHASQKASLIAAGMLLDQKQSPPSSNRGTNQALQYAYKQLEGWDWQRSVNREIPIRWLAACTLLMVLVAYVLSNLSIGGMSERWLTLWNSSATDDAHLVFIDPPRYVYFGQTIRVTVRGTSHAEMKAVKLDVQGDHREVKRVSIDEKQLAVFEVIDVRSDLRLRSHETALISSAVLEIPLKERPRVLRHEYSIIPPDYLKKPSYRSDKAELTIAQGSKLSLRVRLNESIHALQLNAAANSQIIATINGKAQVNAFDFDLTQLTDIQKSKDKSKKPISSVAYQFTLSAPDSQAQQYTLEYPLNLRVQSDTPPAFKFISPTLDKPSQMLARVGERLRAAVTDDYGIDSATLVVHGVSTALPKQNEELVEQRVLLSRATNADTSSPAPNSLDVDQALLRSVFVSKWPTCDAIECSIIAIDNAGQETHSPKIRLLLYSPGSSEAKAIQTTSNIVQLQEQLQDRTDRVANSGERSKSQLTQLAADQNSIVTKWQESLKDQNRQSADQKKVADSIEQLMRSSENQLNQGRLFESSTIQTGILNRLNQFAQQMHDSKNANDQGKSSRDLATSLQNWSKQQSDVAAALKEHVDSASPPESMKSIMESEAKLNREIQQQLSTMPEQSSRRWPLSQASKAIARADAKLQRNITNASTLADAQAAADILESMLENAAGADPKGTNSEESSDNANEDAIAGVMQELQIIRSLQSALHERLEAMGSDAENNVQAAEALRTISENQSELANRVSELSESMESNQQ